MACKTGFETIMRTLSIFLAGLLLATSLLTACGKKGALYLPDEAKNPPQHTQVAPQ